MVYSHFFKGALFSVLSVVLTLARVLFPRKIERVGGGATGLPVARPPIELELRKKKNERVARDQTKPRASSFKTNSSVDL